MVHGVGGRVGGARVHGVGGGGVGSWRVYGVCGYVMVWVVGWVVGELMEWVHILTHPRTVTMLKYLTMNNHPPTH